jgi:hypothetical protein
MHDRRQRSVDHERRHERAPERVPPALALSVEDVDRVELDVVLAKELLG